VEPRFVTPPAAERQRIEEERHLLANTFGRATPDRLWRGPFATPVDGAGTSSFGRLTLLNGRPNGRHQGADFRAALGTPVRAPNSGRIVLVADLYFAGTAVVIDHGLGLFSLFAHLERAAVEVGAVVARGDLIGEAGATGRVTGPHLHWAVRLGEISVDPLSVMATTAAMTEPEPASTP
jgi:murein DD-endopeptidase MepM/ murein hydrolase activator NlpD